MGQTRKATFHLQNGDDEENVDEKDVCYEDVDEKNEHEEDEHEEDEHEEVGHEAWPERLLQADAGRQEEGPGLLHVQGLQLRWQEARQARYDLQEEVSDFDTSCVMYLGLYFFRVQ